MNEVSGSTHRIFDEIVMNDIAEFAEYARISEHFPEVHSFLSSPEGTLLTLIEQRRARLQQAAAETTEQTE